MNGRSKLLLFTGFFILSCLSLPSRAAPEPMVDVCHNGRLISINGNALDAHLGHGDVQPGRGGRGCPPPPCRGNSCDTVLPEFLLDLLGEKKGSGRDR